MGDGDLHAYLQNPSTILKVQSIFSYIFQILDAMIYLGEKYILHRDLTARNCLLNESYETLKISDFELARKMDINFEYISEESCSLPMRWIALETFKFNKFTVKGDIWSFGVLIWEMFERGNRPYANQNGMNTIVEFLESGQRLHHPQYCPDKLYEIMLKCWKKVPEERPNFEILKSEIRNIYKQLHLVELDTHVSFNNDKENECQSNVQDTVIEIEGPEYVNQSK